jgi:hypothetical protein
MDGERFDGIVRALARVRSRRGVAGIAASVLGAAFLAPESSLACKKVGKKCDKNKDCCDGATCKGGKNGKCRCKGGRTECGGKCFDLESDGQHCEGCGVTCADGEACVGGVCAEGGCTAALDSCAAGGSAGTACMTCPNVAESVCYLDSGGAPRCNRFLLCFPCASDSDCETLTDPGARCVACAGQCSGTATGTACAWG